MAEFVMMMIIGVFGYGILSPMWDGVSQASVKKESKSQIEKNSEKLMSILKEGK